MTTAPRKPKRMLTAEQKYDLWVRMLTGQISQADAAVEAQRMAPRLIDWNRKVKATSGDRDPHGSNSIRTQATPTSR